jgi:hypothetical protein
MNNTPIAYLGKLVFKALSSVISILSGGGFIIEKGQG